MKVDKYQNELINVHRVIAEKEVIQYFRISDPQLIEGLFYQAKRTGSTKFLFHGKQYDLVRNKDGSYTAKESETQNYTTEAFS